MKARDMEKGEKEVWRSAGKRRGIREERWRGKVTVKIKR